MPLDIKTPEPMWIDDRDEMAKQFVSAEEDGHYACPKGWVLWLDQSDLSERDRQYPYGTNRCGIGTPTRLVPTLGSE